MSPESLAGASLLPAAEFERLCGSGRVLVSKSGRPALLVHDTAGGARLMTKLWWRGALFSSDRLYPYARRFRRALRLLAARGVAVPEYRAHGRVRGAGARFVVYRPLDGSALRERYETVDVARLAGFVCALHDRGIYFRGLHLGNVIACADGRLGLVDVQDVRFFRGPLSRRRRERNLGILCSHPRDLGFMLDGTWSELVLAYARAAGYGVSAAASLRQRVHRQLRRRHARRAARRLRRGLPAQIPVTDKIRG